MRRRLLLILVAVAVVVLGAGGAYYKFVYSHDPLREGRVAMLKGDYATAEIQLRNAVRNEPSYNLAHFQLGYVQLRRGDAVAAEKEFRTALALKLSEDIVKPQLAQAYIDQGKFKQLLADFPVPDNATGELPARLLVSRGIAEFALKNYDAAKADVARAQSIKPDLTEAVFAAAKMAAVQQDLPTAETMVDRMLEIDKDKLDPQRLEAELLKAEILSVRGDRAGAKRYLDTALAEQPRFGAARLSRANLNLVLGQDADAKADASAVLEFDPKNPQATYLLGVIATRAKKWSEADADFQRVSPVLSRFPRGYFFSAIVKYNLGQMEQAADFAERYAARTPNDPEGVKLVARIALANHRPEAAVDILNKAASAGTADAEVLDLLGRAYTLAGRPGQAVSSFQKATELAPENADILTRLASTRLQTGDASGAAADLEHSLKIAPGQTNANEAYVVAALAAGDLPRAQQALDKLRAAQGETEVVGNLTGLMKMATLDIPGARTAFEAVLKEYPTSIPAQLNLAKIAGLQGKPAEVEQRLNDLLAQAPANEPALSAMLAILLPDGRVARAIELMTKALDKSPGNVSFTAVLSDLYIRAGDAQKANAVLDAAPKEQASVPALLGARARVQVALGNFDDARETYRKVLAGNPRDIDARGRLVNLMMAAGDSDGAKSVLRDGLAAQPGNLSMLQALVSIDQRKGGLDAALATATALERDPANMPAARLLKGDIYIGLKQFPDAEKAFAAEYRDAPSSELATRLASVQSAQGHFDQASNTLKDWLKQDPNSLEALSALSSLDIRAGRLDEAQTHLTALLAKRPNDPAAMNNLAWTYGRIKDPRAEEVAQKAYLIAPSTETADTLGWILFGVGKTEQARQLLHDANLRQPNNAAIAYHYAAALAKTGQKDEAARLVATALASSEAFDERADAQKLASTLGAAH